MSHAKFLLLGAVLLLTVSAGAEELTVPPLETVELSQADTCQPSDSNMGNYGLSLDCARKASWEKDYQRSEAFYQRAIAASSNPDSAYTARYELARVYSWENKYDEALALLDELSVQYPDKPEARALKAQVTGWKGWMYDSYRQYRHLGEQFPDNYDVRLGTATTQSMLGFYGSAEENFEDLQKDYPDRPEPWVNYGQSLAWEGRLLKSKDVLGDARQKFPDNADADAAYFDTTTFLNKPDMTALDSDKLRDKRESFLHTRHPYIQAFHSWHNEDGNPDEKNRFHQYPVTLGFFPTVDTEVFGNFNASAYTSGEKIAKEQRYTYGLGVNRGWTDRLYTTSWFGISNFSNEGGVELYGRASASYRVCDYWQPTLAYTRYPVEDSLMSATGLRPSVGPLSSGLAGRVTRNEWWFRNDFMLPYQFKGNVSYALGLDSGRQIPENPFQKLEYNIGHDLFKTFMPNWKSTFYSRYEGRYWHFKDDRLANGGAYLIVRKFGRPLGSDGFPPNGNPKTGGYFSPDRYFYQGFRLGNRGIILSDRIKYDISGVLGFQNISRFGTSFAGGVVGDLSYAITKNLTAITGISYDNLTRFKQFNIYSGLRYQF